jgi:RNA polymerase sigma factor (sigma-70 family)
MSEATKTKWVLTQAAFEKLLLSLDADRERAGEKYLSVRRNLVRFFEGRGFSTAEENADEVFNRVSKKLDEGDTIENVSQYVYGVARMLILELGKQREREQRVIKELGQNEIITLDSGEEEEKALQIRCLNRCLGELPEDGRNLIVAYYQGDKRDKIENRQKLAESLGIPNNALRSRAVRLREKLEDCINACLKKSGKI